MLILICILNGPYVFGIVSNEKCTFVYLNWMLSHVQKKRVKWEVHYILQLTFQIGQILWDKQKHKSVQIFRTEGIS